jgi:predicted nucleic acid-binding protein
MNLTIDANILVNELTRERNMRQSLLMHSALERLYIAEYTWDEAMHVIDNRLRSWVQRGKLTEHAADRYKAVAMAFATSRCTAVVERFYVGYEAEARRRIPDDPDDWHTVALAMATSTAIWTLDQKHFFGCGMAVWNTRVLRAVLTASGETR